MLLGLHISIFYILFSDLLFLILVVKSIDLVLSSPKWITFDSLGLIINTYENQSESCQLSNLVRNPLEFCLLKRIGRSQWNDFCESQIDNCIVDF